MLDPENSGKNSHKPDDLSRLLFIIESASHDATLLALNMVMEGANADGGNAAELADAMDKLPTCANQFSYQNRGRMQEDGSELDSHSWSEVRRVTQEVAKLIGEVSGIAAEALESIGDPLTEGRLPAAAGDLLNEVRSRAQALGQLLDARLV